MSTARHTSNIAVTAGSPAASLPALSLQTVGALVEVISGGSAYGGAPPIGVYRAGWQIEQFLQAAGVTFALNGGSRVGALRDRLMQLRDEVGGHAALHRMVEHVTDAREYLSEPAKGEAVVDHLNVFLEHDGLELVRDGCRVRLRERQSSPVVSAFATKAIALSLDAVQREVERALNSAVTDPPVAVTAACVIIEGVCRSILAELGLPAPAKRDVEGLLRAVQEPLGLTPGRSDLPDVLAADIRQVLGGLTSVAKGIGALRTHGGSAHAVEHGQAPVDARIARFAIYSASTIALFLIETWERHQRRALLAPPAAQARS